MTTGEFLRAAAERIRRVGWLRCRLGDTDGPACAIGTLNCIEHGHVYYIQLHNEAPSAMLAEAVGAIIRAYGLTIRPEDPDYHPAWYAVHTVVDWNNATHQTAESVAAGFERAAALADEEDALKLTPPVAWTHRDPVAATGDERCERARTVRP